MTLTSDLRAEYDGLFASCQIAYGKLDDVSAFVTHLISGQSQYEAASSATNVPWFVIGLVHGMEGDFNFGTHLHNGDSLKHRTVNEPAGRPPHSVGDPPFTWQTSAIDALQYDRFTDWTDWSLAGICYKLEGYNGWGYRSHKINSPYLWSYSNHYTQGKYVSDGHWDANAVSEQVGAITALWKMVEDHLVDLAAAPAS
jgi:lysozyme family protein